MTQAYKLYLLNFLLFIYFIFFFTYFLFVRSFLVLGAFHSEAEIGNWNWTDSSCSSV